jgi:hypothetical protein
VRDPQALGQQQFQLIAEPPALLAEARALVWKLMLEELFPSEILEIRVMHSALAHALVQQAMDVLEQQKPNHEPGLDSGPARLAVERRDLTVDPRPVELVSKLHQLVLHVEDLLEPGPEQIA